MTIIHFIITFYTFAPPPHDGAPDPNPMLFCYDLPPSPTDYSSTTPPPYDSVHLPNMSHSHHHPPFINIIPPPPCFQHPPPLPVMLKFQVRPSTISNSSSTSPSSPSSSCSLQRFSQLSSFSSSSSSSFGDGSEREPPASRAHRDNIHQDVPHQNQPPTSVRFRRRRPPSPSLSLPDVSCCPSSPFFRKSEPTQKATENRGEWGNLKVYTALIKEGTDYKTLRVSAGDTAEGIVRQLVMDKLRLQLRDLNLFHLYMEVRTRRADGTEARSMLELDRQARPFELQKCHPQGMSRFILGMDSNATLVRIYDSEVCPESNYKSVLISRRTSCAEVLQMLHKMCRMDERDDGARIVAARSRPRAHTLHSSPCPRHSSPSQLGLDAISELRLFVVGPRGTQFLVPMGCPLAGTYLGLLPGQKIVLRRVIVPTSEGL